MIQYCNIGTWILAGNNMATGVVWLREYTNPFSRMFLSSSSSSSISAPSTEISGCKNFTYCTSLPMWKMVESMQQDGCDKLKGCQCLWENRSKSNPSILMRPVHSESIDTPPPPHPHHNFTNTRAKNLTGLPWIAPSAHLASPPMLCMTTFVLFLWKI